VSITCARTLADVLVLYPSVSLRGQMDSWSQRHPERLLKMSFERSLPEIRKLLRRTETAMIDATADSARAVDAFLQAAAHLGTDKVAVYTEAMPDDLEVFIRARGALLLFGPLFEGQVADRSSAGGIFWPGGRAFVGAGAPPVETRPFGLAPGEHGRQLTRIFIFGI